MPVKAFWPEPSNLYENSWFQSERTLGSYDRAECQTATSSNFVKACAHLRSHSRQSVARENVASDVFLFVTALTAGDMRAHSAQLCQRYFVEGAFAAFA